MPGPDPQHGDPLIKVLQRNRQWEKVRDWPHTRRPSQHIRGWNELCQLRGNLGTLEPLASQPAGKGATVEYRFRNGKKVSFVAHAIEQREHNVHVHAGIGEDEYVGFREGRDAELGMPLLIIPSLQANIRAGDLPEPETNGVRYFKVPIDAL